MQQHARPATRTSEVPDAANRPSADRDLVVLFTRALRHLGDAGYPVAANRLAGKAWWALKEDDPKGARRINGIMHYLAELPEETAEPGRTRTP